MSNQPSFLVKYHYALSLSINRLQDGTIYGDSSGPLFAIYSKSVEKIDNMMAERWQKDAEGILIFVCTKGRLLHCCVLICGGINRTVSSLQSSLQSSSFRSKTSGPIRRIHPHFTSRKSINFRLTPVCLSHPHPLLWSSLQRSLPLHMPSG